MSESTDAYAALREIVLAQQQIIQTLEYILAELRRMPVDR